MTAGFSKSPQRPLYGPHPRLPNPSCPVRSTGGTLGVPGGLIVAGLIFSLLLVLRGDAQQTDRPPSPPPAIPVPVHAAERPVEYVRVRVLRVVDGDTLRVDVLFPWEVALRDQSVRLLGFDAPELSRARRSVEVTDAELVRGRAARDALEELIASSAAAYLIAGDDPRDSYGRLLGRLSLWRDATDDAPAELIDVAAWMADHGHVRPSD